MKVRHKIKKDLGSIELRELGYKLSIQQSGYISQDGATIIHLFRKPYIGQVSLHDITKEAAHKANIQKLQDLGYLEE